MKLPQLAIAAFIAFSVSVSASAQERPAMTVWKSPWCGCCGNWVKHMENAGYKVEVTNLE
jgi:hypothetical protein